MTGTQCLAAADARTMEQRRNPGRERYGSRGSGRLWIRRPEHPWRSIRRGRPQATRPGDFRANSCAAAGGCGFMQRAVRRSAPRRPMGCVLRRVSVNVSGC